jgi:hypothetical protein
MAVQMSISTSLRAKAALIAPRTLTFLNSLSAGDDRIIIHEFEVYHNLEDRDYFFTFASAYGIEPAYVPTTFIGDQYWIGFSDEIQAEMEQKIQFCLENECIDHGADILPSAAPPEQLPTVEPPPEEEPELEKPDFDQPESEEPGLEDPEVEEFTINVPLIGKINLADQSLLISTLLISFVDGFNPCSIWVLSMLLAITLNTRSRKKVLIIGFVFIFVTAFVYALFIGGFSLCSPLSVIWGGSNLSWLCLLLFLGWSISRIIFGTKKAFPLPSATSKNRAFTREFAGS